MKTSMLESMAGLLAFVLLVGFVGYESRSFTLIEDGPEEGTGFDFRDQVTVTSDTGGDDVEGQWMDVYPLAYYLVHFDGEIYLDGDLIFSGFGRVDEFPNSSSRLAYISDGRGIIFGWNAPVKMRTWQGNILEFDKYDSTASYELPYSLKGTLLISKSPYFKQGELSFHGRILRE